MIIPLKKKILDDEELKIEIDGNGARWITIKIKT